MEVKSLLSKYSPSWGDTAPALKEPPANAGDGLYPQKLPVWWGRHSPCLQEPGLRRLAEPLAWCPSCDGGGRGQASMTSLVGGAPLAMGMLPAERWRVEGLGGCGLGLEQVWGWGTSRLSFLPPSSTTPSILIDEPTSPSIDLQAKHVPASAVVSSAMNSAPVLGTSPSSPTFTFALGRHYSRDCSECSPPPDPRPALPFAVWPPQSLLGLLPDV